MLLRGAVFVSAFLLLTGCVSTPAKPPECHGAYTPINVPDHYPAPEKKS